MSIYAIGDLHGSLVALQSLFSENPFTQEDTIIFLGDYVDKGSDTKGVIDWLLAQKRNFNFEFIKGNHELLMINAQTNDRKEQLWLENGGLETLTSYKLIPTKNWKKEIPAAHWDFILGGQSMIQIEDWVFVHAGLNPHLSLEAQTERDLFWNKYETPSAYPGKTVICGHTARKNGEIANFGHTICLDTHAFGGQWLSCLDVHTGEYIQTNNEGGIRKGKL